jgi:hypothetical protein
MPIARRPPGPSLREAKANCRQALVGAKAADPKRSALLDSLYVETIQVCKGAPANVAVEMLRWMRICLRVMQDRVGWSARPAEPAGFGAAAYQGIS